MKTIAVVVILTKEIELKEEDYVDKQDFQDDEGEFDDAAWEDAVDEFDFEEVACNKVKEQCRFLERTPHNFDIDTVEAG